MFRDLIEDLDGFFPEPEPEHLLDVPFVPTDENVIDAMLSLGDVGPHDLLYDLGSGDGRILITAARKRNTHGIGIEIDPVRIADAMEEAAHFRVEFMVDFIEDDLFTADISKATVVTLYLLESINTQLRPRLLNELRPGSRIISHAFRMGDWRADEQIELGGINIYKWVVPARVAGAWEWDCLADRRYRVELEQKYQDVSGSAWIDDEPAELKSASLQGPELILEIVGKGMADGGVFTLHVENGSLQSVQQDV